MAFNNLRDGCGIGLIVLMFRRSLDFFYYGTP